MSHRASCLALAAIAVLAGCANLNDTGMSILSTRVPAFAVINGQLVQGDMTLYTDRTGTVTLGLEAAQVTNNNSSVDFPAAAAPVANPVERPVLYSCQGRFRYTATTYGAIDLRCNEGSTSELRIAMVGETRGYGYGTTASGQASLTFGMTPTEARAHLTAPAGKQLQESSGASGLEMR